jgi:hypothetical protein
MCRRVFLSSLLLGGVLMGGTFAFATDKKEGKLKQEQKIEYFCPMHPSIVRDDPRYGKCPICFMPFSRQKAWPGKLNPEERVQQWKADLTWHRAEIVPAIRSNLDRLLPEDRLLAEAQGWCPILEANPLGLIGPPVKITVKGQPVFLCCKDCATDAKKDSNQTLVKVDSLKALLKKHHDVQGKIVRMTVTIEHQDIPGVLKKGRMEFSVEGVKGLESLKAGDLIQGKLKLKDGDYNVTELSPTKTGQRPVSSSATLVGVVEVDETKLVRIAARLKGRIDKLHVTLSGQKVKKGEALADVFSPDLMVTAQNLLDARRGGNQELERTARDRLRLWGMDQDQIEEILKGGKASGHVTLRSPISGHVLRKHQVEGSYLEEGALLFDVADLSTVWIEAEIHDQADVPLLKSKLPARVTAEAISKRDFEGEVVGLFRDEKTSVLKARIAVRNPRDELLPGMLATILLNASAAVPEGNDSKLKVLLQERLAASRALVKAATAGYQTGKVSFERLHQAQQSLLHSQLDLCGSDKERITVLEEAVTLAKNYESHAAARYKSGLVTHSDVLLAAVARLEAEIALEKTKSKVPSRPE